MSLKKIIHASMKVFKQKMNEFCNNGGEYACETLNSSSFELLTRALLQAVQACGQEGLKTFLQEHNVQQSTVAYDDVSYRYKNDMDKAFLTLFGEITVSRSIYSNDLIGGGYVVPLDKTLGLLPDDYATLETREMLLFFSSLNIPSDVETLLKKSGLCHPSKTAIQNMIKKDGHRMEQTREALNQKVLALDAIPEDATILVSSLDGANVRLREKGSKKGEKTKRPVNGQIPRQSSSSFRNAMVGSFSFYRPDEDGNPDRIHSRYIARAPEETYPVFKQEFERVSSYFTEQAQSRNIPMKKIMLCDGHRSIWNYVTKCSLYDDYEFLIDFYHTTEHLSKAGEAIFGSSSSQGQKWYNHYKEKLFTDLNAPQSIIRSIQRYMKRRKLPKSRLENLKHEFTFFKRNKKLMRYCEFIEKGYPIGSGPVEAAAKTIVKHRMCKSGMQWNRSGAQHILTLRAYAKSGTWSNMWKAYTKQLLKIA